MIFSATKLYLDNNNIEVTDTNCDITLQKLIDYGLLDKSAATYPSE